MIGWLDLSSHEYFTLVKETPQGQEHSNCEARTLLLKETKVLISSRNT